MMHFTIVQTKEHCLTKNNKNNQEFGIFLIDFVKQNHQFIQERESQIT